MTGRVKKFNAERGFGFIERDDQEGRDVFVHVSQLVNADSLSEGDRVEFDLDTKHAKGPRALHVTTSG